MKSRRKGKRSPLKQKRISLGIEGKNPIRRNPVRSTRNNKKPALPKYESPLRHLRYNGPTDCPSTSLDSIKSEVDNSIHSSSILESSIKSETEKGEILKNEVEDEVNLPELPSTSFNSGTVKKEIQEQETKDEESGNKEMNINHIWTDNPENSKKRNTHSFFKSNDKPNPKRRKLKKSILSKFHERDECNEFTDSIILVDDSDNESSPIKPDVNNSIKNTVLPESPSNSYLNKSVNNTVVIESEDNKSLTQTNETTNNNQSTTNNEDVVVIINDSSLMEMEAYHDAFNESTNSKEPDTVSSQLVDSVIVIDPDDESPVETRNPTPKLSEDCFVVWSSCPEPCTSNDLTDSQLQPSNLNWNNSDILKQDKISIDTTPNLSNMKFLNNENDKPNKRKIMKSPKVNMNGTKKATLKSILDKTKDITTHVNFASRVAQKAASKITTKISAKAATQNKTAIASKPVSKATPKLKNKVKNAGGLIYLSDSINEGETTTKKRNSKKDKLREIVIDGNNIAMAFTHNKQFSEKGIKLLIDYFTKRGHTVKVFIPQYRRSRNFPLLEKWYTDGIVVFTPSRKLGNKSFTPYDDRYILEYATTCGGIVVSQDQFRDLYAEKPQYRDTIENRILVPTFVGDYVMFPEDPLGRNGPTLDNFLRH